MTRIHWSAIVLGVALAVGAAGCIVRPARATVAYTVAMEPPPPRHVVVTVRPGYVWVDGYWHWNGHDYVWYDGYYEPERSGHVYVQGNWQRRGGKWHWAPGHWKRHGGGGHHARPVQSRGHGRAHGDVPTNRGRGQVVPAKPAKRAPAHAPKKKVRTRDH